MNTKLNHALIRDDATFVLSRVAQGCLPESMVKRAISLKANNSILALIEKYYWRLSANTWRRLSEINNLNVPEHIIKLVHSNTATSAEARIWLRSMMAWQQKGVRFHFNTWSAFWNNEILTLSGLKREIVKWITYGEIDLVQKTTEDLKLDCSSSAYYSDTISDTTILSMAWQECLRLGALDGLSWCQSSVNNDPWITWLYNLCHKLDSPVLRDTDTTTEVRNIESLLIPYVVSNSHTLWSYVALLHRPAQRRILINTLTGLQIPDGWRAWLLEEGPPPIDNWVITVQWIIQSSTSLKERVKLMNSALAQKETESWNVSLD